MKLVVGPPARGDDLWGRGEEIGDIWKALAAGHVLLVAPRRFGKTSIMLNLSDEPKADCKVFYFDLEWMKGPEYLVAEIASSLMADNALKQTMCKTGDFLSGIIARVAEIQVTPAFKLQLRDKLAGNWKEKGVELINDLIKYDGNILLIMDELPLMVKQLARENRDEVQEFLYWLRALRQKPHLSNTRFIIGGSIGMDEVLRQNGIDSEAINDLNKIRICPFSSDKTGEFVELLLRSEGKSEEITPEIIGACIQYLGVSSPYFVQMFVSELIAECRYQKKPLSQDMVRQAYSGRVLAPYNRNYFEHYYSRIAEYYVDERASAAKKLLLYIATNGATPRNVLRDIYQDALLGKGSEEDLNYLLSDLENDFYIQLNVEKGTYDFATKILKDWWLRYYSSN